MGRSFALQLLAAHSRLVPILFLTIRQILISVKHQAVSTASAVAVCEQVMTLSLKSARFSDDAHAPTVTTPRFTNCCSQRTFVDNMTYTSNTFASSYATCCCTVQPEFGSNFQSQVQQDFPNQHCLTGGDACMRRTQLRHLSVRVLSACVMQNTADTHQLQISNSSLTFPACSLSDQTRKNASCGSESVPEFHEYNSR